MNLTRVRPIGKNERLLMGRDKSRSFSDVFAKQLNYCCAVLVVIVCRR